MLSLPHVAPFPLAGSLRAFAFVAENVVLSLLAGWYGVDCSGRNTGNFRTSSCERSSTSTPGSLSTSVNVLGSNVANQAGRGVIGWIGFGIVVSLAVCTLVRCLRNLLGRRPKEPLPDFVDGPAESAPLLDDD